MQTLKSWLPAFSGMTCLGFGAGLISIYGFFVEPLSQEFGVGAAAINIGPVCVVIARIAGLGRDSPSRGHRSPSREACPGA